MPRASKRPQFVAAAREVFHECGYESASLADVAERADLPVGNLYYYFKTKSALCGAVIDTYLADLEAWFGTLDALEHPTERMLGYVDGLTQGGERKARFGCPMFSLVSELAKRDDGLAETAGQLVEVQLRWLRRTLGLFPSSTPRVAEDWLALVSGSYALAQARHDVGVLERRRRYLRQRARGL